MYLNVDVFEPSEDLLLRDERKIICEAADQHQHGAKRSQQRSCESCRGENSAQQTMHGDSDDRETFGSVPEAAVTNHSEEFART